MFARSINTSIQPFLMRSERLLGAGVARKAGANAYHRHADVKVDRRMIVAVTSRRLLIFFKPKVKALLGEVEGHRRVPAGLAKAVTLRVRGSAIGIESQPRAAGAATGVAAADRRWVRR